MIVMIVISNIALNLNASLVVLDLFLINFSARTESYDVV